METRGEENSDNHGEWTTDENHTEELRLQEEVKNLENGADDLEINEVVPQDSEVHLMQGSETHANILASFPGRPFPSHVLKFGDLFQFKFF